MLQFIKSQVAHIAGRRRYRDVFSFGARMRSTSIRTIPFEGFTNYKGNLIVVPSNLTKLMLCKKSGIWQKSISHFRKGYRWTSKFQPYFAGGKHISYSTQFNPVFMEEVKLKVFRKCRVTLDPDRHKSLNMYACRLNLSLDKPNHKQAILLSINGADSFQHFVQDCLPLLAFVEELNEIPPCAPLILLSPSENFSSLNFYLQSLGISRPLIFMSDQNSFVVDELFVLDFKPFNALYNLPSTMYLSLHKKLRRQPAKKPNKVILVERSEKVRNFADIEIIRRKINKWAHVNNLDLVILKPHLEELDTIVTLFAESKYVFAIHGGANYNIIWASQESTLVEFLPIFSTNSLFHLALSFEQNYLPFALNHAVNDVLFHISEESIDSVFLQLDSLQKRSRSQV